MKLTPILEKFFAVVSRYHAGQKRKYTGEPYVNHLLSVAELVSKVTDSETIIAMALGHDLLEDTTCTMPDCKNELIYAGFDEYAANHIVIGISWLTDVFTPDTVPGNRAERKRAEAHRLRRAPDHIHTVKYADLIDNTKSIVKHDHKFAKVYLAEKRYLLECMRLGDLKLFHEAYTTLIESEELLNLQK